MKRTKNIPKPYYSKVDLVLTDPPYGINYNPNEHKKYNGTENSFTKIKNDIKPIDIKFLLEFPSNKIIWGLENYLHLIKLPCKGKWICWYKRGNVKRNNSMSSGD